MLESFAYYLKKGKIVKQSISAETVKSLLKKAKKRYAYVCQQQLSHDNADFLFEDIYESIREAAQSLLAVNNYKPYSHEALIVFLKETYDEFTPAEMETFDEYRRIRNRLVYYAESISLEKTEQALDYLRRFLLKVESLQKRG